METSKQVVGIFLIVGLMVASWNRVFPDALLRAAFSLLFCWYAYQLAFGSAVADISRYWGWRTADRERALRVLGRIAGAMFFLIGAVGLLAQIGDAVVRSLK
jgi:uncharacterized membrane protein YfcA